MLTNRLVLAALAGLASLPHLVHSHTWVEQLNVIAQNGTMIQPAGFPRGNVKRSDPTFGDAKMVQLIPPNGGTINDIASSQLMCKDTQTTQSQTSGSPRLQAAPGALVALRYQENGHVTLPQNQPGKPNNRGTNFVYYTTNAKSDDKFLQIHRQWTADGKGGDGRGQLISTQNFDDGQCYQVNGDTISQTRQATFKHTADALQGGDLWCQQDIQIPADAPAGSTITLYWVWDWPTMPGTTGFPQGKQEIYTTCMDVDIVQSNVTVSNKAAGNVFAKGQDFVSAAVASQFTNAANPTAVTSPQLIPFSNVAAVGSTNAATAATSSVVGTVTANTIVSLVSSQPAIGKQSTTQVVGSEPATVYVTVTNTVTTVSVKTVTVSAQNVRPGAASVTSNVIVPINPTATPTPGVGDQPKPTPSSIPVPTNRPTQTETQTETVVPTQRPQHQNGTFTFTNISRRQDAVLSRMVTIQSAAAEAISSPSSSGSASSCSKANHIYRLRARNPFYVVPDSDLPPHSTDAC